MTKETGIIVLIPAFREELTIATVVTLANVHCDKVIVVNDGSPDRTREVAELAGAEVLTHQVNQGKAAALMTGFARCRELAPKCVVMIDGDGQMDPALIPTVAAPVLAGEADLVIGSRYIGTNGTDTPTHRRVGQKMLNKVTNIGSTQNVTDTQSGYRALSLKAINNMDFHSEKYNVESDMILHFANIGLKITEIPVTVRYDVPDGHKQKPLSHGLSIFERMVSYIGYRRPLLVFGAPGAISFIIGLIISLATFFEVRVLLDWTLVSQGIFGIVFFGIGTLLIFAALILNSLSMLMKNLERTIKRQL